MHTKYPSLLLAGILTLSASLSVIADETSDVLGVTAAPPAAVPVAVPEPVAADPALVVDPTAAPAVADPAYMPDPASAAPAAPAAEAAPAVPQISQAEKDSQFWLAAKNGDSVTVASMLQQGATPNTTNDNGATAVHAATAFGSLPLVIYLHKSGVDINATTAKGWTAMHTAARFGKADIANYLKQQGLNPNQATTDGTGKSPVQMALDLGDLRIARILGY